VTNDYTVLIVWEGASSKIKLKDGEIASAIVGVAARVVLLVCVFFLPYLYRKLVLGDWQLQWWHTLQGPLLRLDEIPPRPEGVSDVQDYYPGYLTK
jgi:sodium-dependent phosphate transporter